MGEVVEGVWIRKKDTMWRGKRDGGEACNLEMMKWESYGVCKNNCKLRERRAGERCQLRVWKGGLHV